MMFARSIPFISLLAGVLLLTGCGRGDDLTDLKRWVAEVQARPRPPIEPLPEFRPYESFSYSAANLRSPFEPPVEVKPLAAGSSNKDVKPDPHRVREYLEEFSFDALQMVGTITRDDGILWALISDSEGSIHRVKIGNYLGRNHGRIIEVSETAVNVIEIVVDGKGGYVERPRSLTLKLPK